MGVSLPKSNLIFLKNCLDKWVHLTQEALKLQHEQCKQERKIRSKEQKEAEEQRMFELKQRKRLEKHKGH